MVQAVVEIDGPRNESVHFLPAGVTVRGRLDWNRCGEPLTARLARHWGEIPGQQIELTDKGGCIVEPLHNQPHAALAEKIKAEGMTLAPARHEFPAVDWKTWAYWLQRAIDAGVAKLISGELPVVDPKDAKRDYFQPPPDPSQEQLKELGAAMRQQAEQIGELVKAIKSMVAKR